MESVVVVGEVPGVISRKTGEIGAGGADVHTSRAHELTSIAGRFLHSAKLREVVQFRAPHV